jgi:hypothetical protein
MFIAENPSLGASKILVQALFAVMKTRLYINRMRLDDHVSQDAQITPGLLVPHRLSFVLSQHS